MLSAIFLGIINPLEKQVGQKLEICQHMDPPCCFSRFALFSGVHQQFN